MLTNDEKGFIIMMYAVCLVMIGHGIRAIRKKEYGDLDTESGFLIGKKGKEAVKLGKFKIISGCFFLVIATLFLLLFMNN